MNRRYVVAWAPDHPLRGKRGEVLEHRAVLYDAIGPGTHPCHWCKRLVTWRVRTGEPPLIDDLVVDHLDGDPTNNALENLVPSCQPCNVAAGYSPVRIGPDETFLVRPSGDLLRAIVKACAQCGGEFLTAVGEDRPYCTRRCANEAKRRDVCKRGHSRAPENLTNAGQCRECMRMTHRAYRARKKARADN